MSNNIPSEKDLVFDLATKYEQGGYKVVMEPNSRDLPFDLGNYRPDLVASSTDKGYIIEVKTAATRTPIDRYSEISEIVAQHPGWRFLLVTGEHLNEQTAIAEEPLSWEQIPRQVAQADKLLADSNVEVAFLALWTTFEALLRRQALQILLPIEHFPSSALIKHLYSRGELSMAQFDQALELLEIRNRVIHGFMVTDVNESTQQLSILVHDLLELWQPSPL